MAAPSPAAWDGQCDLSVALDYDAPTLAIGFEIGATQPTTWNAWLVIESQAIALLSAPLPALEPAVAVPLSIPLPALGHLGVLTTLTTTDGIVCHDWQMVPTAP